MTTQAAAPHPTSHRSHTADNYWRLRRTPAHTAFRAARDLLHEHRDAHDQACTLFDWPRPTHFNWAPERFDVIAADNHTPALLLIDDDGGSTTVGFAELSRRSDAVAGWLTSLGVRRGERVLVVLDQRLELWETLLACLKIGAVVIPTYTSLSQTQAADRLERGAVRHVICESALTDHFRPDSQLTARVAVGPATPAGWRDYAENRAINAPFHPTEPTQADAVAFCYFTSGTTSLPKLVAHTHTSYPVGHLSGMYLSGLRPGDRHLNISAPGWAKHSWSSLFVPWNAGATIVVPPPAGIPAARLPALMARHAVSTFCAPTSTWRAMLGALDSARPPLRAALSAGEPLDTQVSRTVHRAWGVPVRDGYGQTETTGLIGTTPGLDPRPGWLGKPLPGYRIGLRDPDTGHISTSGAALGEVCVLLTPAPAGLMAGYLSSGETNVLRTDTDTDCYATGDQGERSADGWIRIHGRTDDVFKSFDHRISPYELEAVLRRHPAVADAAVVPRPHPLGSAVPHAVVELAPGWTRRDDLEQELLAHADRELAHELRIHSLAITARLPRTASGKVRRAALRTRSAGTGQAGPTPT